MLGLLVYTVVLMLILQETRGLWEKGGGVDTECLHGE